MTNKALELYFQNEGIEFTRADVGDKYVLQRLIERSWTFRWRAFRSYNMFR